MIDAVTATKIADVYYDEVRAFCLSKLQNNHDADDITQDTFLLFQLKADVLEDNHIIAWLINTANNLIKHFFRENKRFIFEELNESHLSVDDILECIERENPVTPEVIEEQKQKVLATLNETETAFFIKRYVEHVSYEEMAREFNMTENAARIHCCRLRKKIMDEAKLITSAWILLVARLFFENF